MDVNNLQTLIREGDVATAFAIFLTSLLGVLSVFLYSKIRDKLQMIKNQVTNSHNTNLRDDIDKIYLKLGEVHELIGDNARNDVKIWEEISAINAAAALEHRAIKRELAKLRGGDCMSPRQDSNLRPTD